MSGDVQHWYGNDLADKLAALLRPALEPIAVSAGTRAAAVLAVLYPFEDELFIPLIQRPDGQGVHSGQLALPGGGHEPTDRSLLETAIREAGEEVSLDPTGVRVLGRLPAVSVLVSGFEAVPFVAWLENKPQLVANPAEVAAIIEFPVKLLIEPTALRQVPNPPGSMHPTMYECVFGEHRVWGATARMLANLSLALNSALA